MQRRNMVTPTQIRAPGLMASLRGNAACLPLCSVIQCRIVFLLLDLPESNPFWLKRLVNIERFNVFFLRWGATWAAERPTSLVLLLLLPPFHLLYLFFLLGLCFFWAHKVIRNLPHLWLHHRIKIRDFHTSYIVMLPPNSITFEAHASGRLIHKGSTQTLNFSDWWKAKGNQKICARI